MNKTKIIVTSSSFSKNAVLRKELLALFPNSTFNYSGKRLSEEELISSLQTADGAIVGVEPISERVIKELKRTQIYSKFGVGLDNIDLDCAIQSNKKIGWTGGINKRSVSEMTLCFILGLRRNIFRSGFKLKENQWNKEGGDQLTNKRVGIIGCGNIGEDLLHLLQPFDCETLICDILDKGIVCQKYGASQVSFEKLMRSSDVITLHVPLTEKTNGMINEKTLLMMKKEAYLINTSRGGVVETTALKEALMNERIAGAALDVFQEEPPTDLELLALPNLMVTPHIGGNAQEAVLAMGRSAIGHLKKFFL